jgi:hypothetical protein
MILYGRWQPFVDAGPVRAHLKELAAAGIGRKHVAELAGISPATLRRLDGLQPGRPATRHMRPETAQAILAIRPGLAACAASARVDPTGTRRRLQALVALGWTQTALADRLGMSVGNFAAMLRRPAVSAGTARAAVQLYDELWNRPAPDGTAAERARARAAKRYAQRHGWPPPLAWDDGALDNPQAAPGGGWQRSARKTWRAADLAAEAHELFGHGLDRRQAADRLGVPKKTLDAALSRATTPPTSTEEDSSMPFDPTPKPAPSYMRGASYAHTLVMRQVDAGHDADRIQERQQAAAQLLADAARADDEREFARGYAETAADHVTTLRDAQRGRAEHEAWERQQEAEPEMEKEAG